MQNLATEKRQRLLPQPDNAAGTLKGGVIKAAGICAGEMPRHPNFCARQTEKKPHHASVCKKPLKRVNVACLTLGASEEP